MPNNRVLELLVIHIVLQVLDKYVVIKYLDHCCLQFSVKQNMTCVAC